MSIFFNSSLYLPLQAKLRICLFAAPCLQYCTATWLGEKAERGGVKRSAEVRLFSSNWADEVCQIPTRALTRNWWFLNVVSSYTSKS